MISINKTPTEMQLGDLETKPQPEDLFVSQRESLMQWEAEYMTKDELTRSAHHLRACDISDSAESLCRIQHEKAERERELRDKAKLASKGVPLSNPGNRLSTNGTHDIAVNDGVHQTIDETGSAIDNKRIVDEQSKETVDDGWKRVSRHGKCKETTSEDWRR